MPRIDDVPVPTEPPRAPAYQALALIAAPWLVGVALWLVGGWGLVLAGSLFAILVILLVAGLVVE